MTDHLAKLFHDTGILMIQHDRTTITVQRVDRDTVATELDDAGFIPAAQWSHAIDHDEVQVRRKEHRFDLHATSND